MDFRLVTSENGEGIYTVTLGGEADLATAPALKQTLADILATTPRGVLIDLSHAKFIDSTTLGVLMGAVKRLRPAGGELAIACHDENICKIFEITLLDRVFPIFHTPEAGVAFLRAARVGQTADIKLLS